MAFPYDPIISGAGESQHASDVAARDRQQKQYLEDQRRQITSGALASLLQNAQTPEEAGQILSGMQGVWSQPQTQHHPIQAIRDFLGRLTGGGGQQPMSEKPPVPGAGQGPMLATPPPAPAADPFSATSWMNTPPSSPASQAGAPAPGGPQRPMPPALKGKQPPVDPAIETFKKYFRSPGQLAQEAALTKAQADTAGMQATYDWWLKNNPGASKEQRQEVQDALMGVKDPHTQWKTYISPDKQHTVLVDPSRPETIPVGYEPYVASTMKSPKLVGKPTQDLDGKWYQWQQMPDGKMQKQPMEGYQPPPPTNKDEKYLAIIQKQKLGQKVTPEETAYAQAWDFFNKQRYVMPRTAYAQAVAHYDRFIPVVNSDGSVTPMPLDVAEKNNAPMVASIGYQMRKAMDIAATTGRIGENLGVGYTALQHLDMLDQAAEALKNGDDQLLNSISQSWDERVMGSPAPTNFDMLRNSFAGEAARLFTGVGATTTEMENIQKTINRAQGPQQLQEAVKTARETIMSRMFSNQARILSAGGDVTVGIPGVVDVPPLPGTVAAPMTPRAPAPGGPARPTPPAKKGSLSDRLNDALGQP